MKIISLSIFMLIFLSSCAFANIYLPEVSHISNNDTTVLKVYVGRYKMAEGSPVESLKFFIKDGNLHVEAEGHGSAVLNLIDEDTFEEPNYKAVFKFIRKEGVVTGFKQEVRGIEMEGIKEKP